MSERKQAVSVRELLNAQIALEADLKAAINALNELQQRSNENAVILASAMAEEKLSEFVAAHPILQGSSKVCHVQIVQALGGPCARVSFVPVVPNHA